VRTKLENLCLSAAQAAATSSAMAEREAMLDTMEQKSKSQVKRDMRALQSLGEQLVTLTLNQINGIEMLQDLREAVLFAKTLKMGEARRRQMQYIGTLMRDVDPEPIRNALEEIGRGRGPDAKLFQELEQWRSGLIHGNDDLLGNIKLRFPDADRKHLRSLALQARKEREENKPPKASRALFRYLRELSKS
jgi:ribosome-associated protein